MDNILKLLLGVLGVAGLIAFVTSNISFEPPAPPPAPPPVIVEGPPTDALNQEQPPEEEESPEEDGEDVLAMGEPMIDGNPYGSNNQQAPQYDPQAQFQQDQSGNFNYGAAPQQQAYGQQQIYAPQPPPGTFIPVNGGE